MTVHLGKERAQTEKLLELISLVRWLEVSSLCKGKQHIYSSVTSRKDLILYL